MLPPFGHIGGVRGPNGTTLTDLQTLLTTIDGRLATLNQNVEGMTASLQQIAGDLRFLSGDPAQNPLTRPSLVDYLFRVLGSVPVAAAQAIRPSAYNVSARADFIVQLLAGSGFTNDGGGELITALLALTAALTSSGAIGGTLPDIRDVLGDISASPEGSSIKDLLRSMDTNLLGLRDCCEGQSGGGGELPPPVGTLCEGADYGPFRVEQFIASDQYLEIGSGGAGTPTYLLDFGELATRTQNLVFRDQDTTQVGPVFAYYAPSTIGICVSWDFTDQTPPQFTTLQRAGTDDWYSGGLSGSPFPSQTATQGSYQAIINANVRFLLAIDVPDGNAMPGRNIFLSISTPS